MDLKDSFEEKREQRKAERELHRKQENQIIVLAIAAFVFFLLFFASLFFIRFKNTQIKELQDLAEATSSDLPAGTLLDEALVTPENESEYFTISQITQGDEVFNRINGRSYTENSYIALEELRYLKILHYNFENRIQVGELIVNASVADDMLAAFKQLFEEKYQLQSVFLVDNYWRGNAADSTSASAEANNTSAFCYEDDGTDQLGNHSMGLAIDINPEQNPYVIYDGDTALCGHERAEAYLDRSQKLPHMIDKEDAAYRIFTELGYRWGGDFDSPKDYQHFDAFLKLAEETEN